LQLGTTTLNQGDLYVFEYFTKLRVIWDELENFWSDSLCTCPTKCTYQALYVIIQHRQEDRVMQFLRGLNDHFNSVKFHILLMELMPLIPKIFSFIMQ